MSTRDNTKANDRRARSAADRYTFAVRHAHIRFDGNVVVRERLNDASVKVGDNSLDRRPVRRPRQIGSPYGQSIRLVGIRQHRSRTHRALGTKVRAGLRRCERTRILAHDAGRAPHGGIADVGRSIPPADNLQSPRNSGPRFNDNTPLLTEARINVSGIWDPRLASRLTGSEE